MTYNVKNASPHIDMAVQEILFNPQLLKKFRQNPDLVLDNIVNKRLTGGKFKSLSADDIDPIKAAIATAVNEGDQVLPGLSREEAKTMLFSSIQSVGLTFSIFTWLNVTLFIVGIALFITAAIAGLVRNEVQFSIVFGSSGVVSLLPFFVTNPLKRISNAASDQTQIRDVIFGYWSQLDNLHHMSEQLLTNVTPEKISMLNGEFQKAMTHAIELLQKNAENAIQEANPETEKSIKEITTRVESLEKKVGVAPPSQPGK